jgi:hypothetical protein
LSSARDRIVARYTLEKIEEWMRLCEGEPREEAWRSLRSRIRSYKERLDLLLADLIDELL